MADLRSIGTAVESFAVDNNVYPVAATPAALKTIVETGAYMKTMPIADGWQERLPDRLRDHGVHAQSPGKLGANNGCVAGALTTLFTADICFQNGQFIQYPNGGQQ